MCLLWLQQSGNGAVRRNRKGNEGIENVFEWSTKKTEGKEGEKTASKLERKVGLVKGWGHSQPDRSSGVDDLSRNDRFE